jgi:SAM-dependent methyltransferase
MSGSVAFDRAAAYYDSTRGLSPEGVLRTTEALAGALGDEGPILEVGVGTGQVALPLRATGRRVVGLDLSRPMLEALVAKDEARDVPVVEGDATAMPFRDDAFAGAYLRWVLHLIGDWTAAIAEIARVVSPDGRFLACLGSYGGIGSEMQARFVEITGVSADPIGLTWDGWDALDAAVAAVGGQKLPDVTFDAIDRDDLETFMRGIERNSYSWTWRVPDEELRRRAAAEVRTWAQERWGPLDRIPREVSSYRFAAYRLG